MSVATDRLKGRSFTKLSDWARPELEAVLDLADELKAARREEREEQRLAGRTVGLLFLKPSTRTRVSFAAGIAQLGGTALPFSGEELHLARGETIRDTAAVLSRYVDANRDPDVRAGRRRATCPARLDAGRERADRRRAPVPDPRRPDDDPRAPRALEGLKLVYVGDGNNVCASLLVGAATFGMHVVAATPAGIRAAASERSPSRASGRANRAARWS